MDFTGVAKQGQGTINSRVRENSTKQKSFSNRNVASVTTTNSQVKDSSMRQKSVSNKNSASSTTNSQVKDSLTRQKSFSNEYFAPVTTTMSQAKDSSTKPKKFSSVSNTNSASSATNSCVKDRCTKQKSLSNKNSALKQVKEWSRRQTSFSNKNSVPFTTINSRVRESLKRDLSRDEAIHILHFLHAYPGTPVLLVVLLKRVGFKNDTIFTKMYRNQEMNGFRKSLHAERQLCNDQDNIIGEIWYHLEQNHIPIRGKAMKVMLFQNNSPCDSCSDDLLRFKTDFPQELQFITNYSIQFEIQFQIVLRNADFNQI